MAEVIARRYEVGVGLGRGGMARVVAARDLRLHRPVALKLLSIDVVDPAGTRRFVQEARSSAGFSHPHAVAVFDAGEADGYLFLVMELIDGPSLATVLAKRGRLDVETAVRIADHVLQALDAAHRAGIVHRDVKPGNVLLTSSGVAKLADFGIAKRLDDLSGDITATGQFVGTPKYLAPEQVEGGPVTPATDVYAAGVVLFEMLAGAAPFDETNPMATALAHRDTPVPDLRVRRPDVPEHVVAVIERAMAKESGDRFQTAEQMRVALLGHQTSVGPVAAPATTDVTAAVAPTPTAVMPTRPPARRRWWVGAVAASIAAVVGAVVLAARSEEPAGDPRTTLAPTSPTTVTAPPTTSPTTTTPPTTTLATTPPPAPAQPTSITELIGLLAVDPDRFGKRGDDLLDELRDVAERSRPRDAQRLRERITEWASEGELAAEVAAAADALLAPIAAQPGDGRGDEDD